MYCTGSAQGQLPVVALVRRDRFSPDVPMDYWNWKYFGTKCDLVIKKKFIFQTHLMDFISSNDPTWKPLAQGSRRQESFTFGVLQIKGKGCKHETLSVRFNYKQRWGNKCQVFGFGAYALELELSGKEHVTGEKGWKAARGRRRRCRRRRWMDGWTNDRSICERDVIAYPRSARQARAGSIMIPGNLAVSLGQFLFMNRF